MSAQGFVHLHVHSHFSLLDGACKVDKLVEQAKKFGMPAIALTDHGNLHGVVQFYSAAKDAEIKPILGCEAYVAPASRFERSSEGEAFYHLTLLAENEQGYRNLVKLSSLAFLEGFYYKPRVDRELLEQYREGLIVLSGCLSSEMNVFLLRGDYNAARASAEKYRDIFGPENFFLELQDCGLEKQKKTIEGTLKIAKELKLEVAATNDIHYLTRSDARAQEALICLNTGRTLNDESRIQMETDELYFKSSEEMFQRFGHISGAVENTLAIAERCNCELNFNERHFPRFETPVIDGKQPTDVEYLRSLCEKGFTERYAADNKQARDRLEYELKVIADMGYSSYFLIVWDFVRFGRSRNIPTSMRGSGVGSVVSYVLGLIDLDPLKHDLIFQRFLDPERQEPPDIDIDFCEFGRETVMQYVKDKYGADNTANIITFGSMKAKAVVRDVGRVLNIPLAEVNAIAKNIPATLGTKLKDALKLVPDLKKLAASGEKHIKELFDISLRLEGLNRHPSIHAAGVCIADQPLTEHVPVCKVGDLIATQFAMGDLEKSGMLKMDFLGVRFLTIVDKTLDLIEKRTGKRPDLMKISTNDRPTYELLASGKARGVFQMSSNGMRNLLTKLEPDNIEDIIAVVALYRPGPLQSGMVDDFIERKHGRQKIKYQHPSLEKVLKTTYGVIVYQEQIMQIANEIAGLTMAEALTMIKAISKKKLKVIAARKEKFIEGACNNGLDKKAADEIFGLIEFFAGYGFNKAHSTAYAYLTYRTAYLKAHYPLEFMAATLSCEMGDNAKIVEYMEECRDMGKQILPPDINESGGSFTIVGDAIRFGLGAVKSVGDKAIDSIVATRKETGPYESLLDFCERVDLHCVNKSVIEALIKCGAFDCTGSNRPTMLADVERALKIGNSAQADRQAGQMTLFGSGGGNADDAPAVADKQPELPDWSNAEKHRYEKEAVGFYVSGHPLQEYRELIDTYAQMELTDLPRMADKDEVLMGGMIGSVSKIITKTGRFAGQPMARFTLESENSSCSCVIFSEPYARFSDYVQADRPVFVKGTVDLTGNSPGIRVDEIIPMQRVREELTNEVRLHVDRPFAQGSQAAELQKVFIEHGGDCMVYFELPAASGENITISVSRRYAVKPTDEFHAALTQMLPASSIEYACKYNFRHKVEAARQEAEAEVITVEDDESDEGGV